VGAEAAHHPHVGLHAIPAQAAAIEAAGVRLGVTVVARREALHVTVEAVGVLHHELAGAQHPGAWARLVALLRLHVVKREWEVAVGAHEPGDVEGHDLLVAHGQHHVRALAILELEQLVDRITASALPQLGRREHRHEHLLGADRVHLLAQDPHHLLVHAPAGRQPGPHPGPDLADEPGAHHHLVRDGLRISRRLALGGQQELGEARHRPQAYSAPGSTWPRSSRLRCER
jgi:hypothetical protein